jgi:hypothetical protein
MEESDELSWMIPIKVMLGSLKHGEVQACSISNVLDKLRGANEDAYKPKHISIGLLHRGATRHLQQMEETKWHYMREFLERQGTILAQNIRSEIRLRECGFDILMLHKVICASYGGSNNNIIKKIDMHEIAEIMIVDGCFLLQFLIRLGDSMNQQITNSYNYDPIFNADEKVLYVLNDVVMLENQIPFIVLKKLYRKVFPDGSEIKDDYRVVNIVRRAFGYPLGNSSGGAHILHLMHLSTVDQNQNQQHQRTKAALELTRCATKLSAFGVKIRAKLNTTNPIQHNLIDMFDFDIGFSNSGDLEIPPLYIKETTEVRWRNLIAWEQSKIWIPCKYTSYAFFFNGLICCEHDIELLKKKNVIVNELKKSNEDLLALFHTISKGAEQMDLSYSQICARLNKYEGMEVAKVLHKWPICVWHQCRRIFEIMLYYFRNWYKILIRDHIPTVWKFIGIVAAATLLVLAVMQTIYSSRKN